MDLSKMSLAKLRELDAAISAEIAGGESRRRAAAVEQIHAVAHALGLPLKSIIQGRAGRQVKQRRQPQGYRDPANAENVWAGAGPRPKWLKMALLSGATLDQLKA